MIRWGCCSWDSEWYFCRCRRRPTSVTHEIDPVHNLNLKFCVATSRERHTVRFIEYFIYPIFLSKPRRPYISNLPSVIVWSLCEETTRRQSEMRYKNKAQSIIYEILFATGFPSSKLQHGQRRRYLRTYSIFRPREYVLIAMVRSLIFKSQARIQSPQKPAESGLLDCGEPKIASVLISDQATRKWVFLSRRLISHWLRQYVCRSVLTFSTLLLAM